MDIEEAMYKAQEREQDIKFKAFEREMQLGKIIDKQEKIINAMAKDILSYEYVAYMGEDIAFKNTEEVKQYYEKKVKGDN